jgi:SHS2 domain-containing protein
MGDSEAGPGGTGWEHLAHAADIGVRGRGPTLASAFEQAALALTAVVTDVSSVRPRFAVAIACEAPSAELLLVDWLNALIFEMATRRALFADFAVTIAGDRLEATARGEAVDVERHQPAVEVKGATYTGLRVEQDADGRWVAECIVDV